MKSLIKRLFVEEQGQDVIEYALLAAGISVMVIPVAPQIGAALVTVYTDILGDVTSI
jgi:Flp pilus assembly pilin Flp